MQQPPKQHGNGSGLVPIQQGGAESPLQAMQQIIEERNMLRLSQDAQRNECQRLRAQVDLLTHELAKAQRGKDFYQRMAAELTGSLQDLNYIICERVRRMNEQQVPNVDVDQRVIAPPATPSTAPTPQGGPKDVQGTTENIAARFAPEGANADRQ